MVADLREEVWLDAGFSALVDVGDEREKKGNYQE